MAKGGRRQYTRDSRGRFSSTGSTRQGRPPAQRVKRGTNRLTRDNAGRITSVGGEGATARGGRLRTAGGSLRATQTARLKGAGGRLRKPVGGGKDQAPATKAIRPAEKAPEKIKWQKVPKTSWRQTATLPGGAKANIQNLTKDVSGAIVRNGVPIMRRSGFRNITEAKKWAANPSARGPRLMGGKYNTESTPDRTWRRTKRRANTIAKPKGLKPGAVATRIMNKDRATIKALDAKMQRAEARSKQLARSQREIDYKRANPIGGKAFRGQATKRLNKQQKKLEKSMAKVFSAKELVYKPKQEKAYGRLAQLHKATQSASKLRVNKKGASYQRSLFGGSVARYF